MVTPLHRDDVAMLLERGVRLVEVLPAGYDDEHLPGAVNIPLKTLGAATTAALDRSRPSIVNCWEGL